MGKILTRVKTGRVQNEADATVEEISQMFPKLMVNVDSENIPNKLPQCEKTEEEPCCLNKAVKNPEQSAVDLSTQLGRGDATSASTATPQTQIDDPIHFCEKCGDRFVLDTVQFCISCELKGLEF